MEEQQNEELLQQLEEELIKLNDQFMEIAVEVLKNQVSKYPIFVAHKLDIPLGKMFINRDIYGTEWSYSISHLEDFVHKKFIDRSKVDLFRKVYKDPTMHMCLFVVGQEGSGMVFFPYR